MPTTPGPAVRGRFSSLDALALARELRVLDHPRVDKAFDWAPDGWAISLKLRAGGRRDLVLVPGGFGAVAQGAVGHGETPGPFARDLRRLLSGARLVRVADPGGERSLDAEFARADGTGNVRLLAEFFGPGNVVLVRDGTIVAVARPRSWAHRTLRPGVPFQPAPASPNPWGLSAGALEVTLLGSTADRASTLAARAGFGGPVAEELLRRAGVAPSPPAREDAGSVAAAVRAAADGLLQEIGDPPRGYVYRRGTSMVEVTPYPSARRRSEPETSEEVRDSFGAAWLDFQAQPAPEASEPKGPDPRRAALERQRDRQRAAVESLTNEAERSAAQGRRIFEQYEEAEAARKEAADRADPEAPATSVEVRIGDLDVRLDPSKTVDESARALFEASKRSKAKLAGARDAMARTEAELAAPAARERRVEPKVAAKPAKPLWFESFRWFVSSEGILVVAGRDAISNDLVVRRYLREGDRYVHADLHGAASVVVKVSGTPGTPTPGDATLREAGIFAVAFSKAWRAGLASSDAFWVTPDQVSKSGASGEFVARGSWVIHGTKHPLRDLPLELAIGTTEFGGRTLWSAAPPAALAARGTVRLYVAPDDERTRDGREVELAREMGIGRELLQRLLPAGGFRIRRA